jgi:hypothetical protein
MRKKFNSVLQFSCQPPRRYTKCDRNSLCRIGDAFYVKMVMNDKDEMFWMNVVYPDIILEGLREVTKYLFNV